MGFSKYYREQTFLTMSGMPVEQDNSFMFLCVHITEDLKLSTHPELVVNMAQDNLYMDYKEHPNWLHAENDADSPAQSSELSSLPYRTSFSVWV